MAARGLRIRTQYSVWELRRLARGGANWWRTSLRMLAIANAIDGLDRNEAARPAGMSGQALCDAIKRYNAQGIDGLYEIGRSRPRRLDAAQERALGAIVIAGPDVEQEGVSAYTREDFCAHRARDVAGVLSSRIDRPGATTVGFSRQRRDRAIRRKTRPRRRPLKRGAQSSRESPIHVAARSQGALPLPPSAR
jgi:winged helix-turn helix protein